MTRAQLRAERAPCNGEETLWFDGGTTPARAGLYQRKVPDGMVPGRRWVWSFFEGSLWYANGVTQADAIDALETERRSRYQRLPWRGLGRPPTRADARRDWRPR